MEPISRISALLERAQELTLDAASAARSSSTRGVRLPDRSQVKRLLDSRNDREILEGLRTVMAMMYRQPTKTLPLFSSIVKNVASPNIEIKKLVYIYLIHHAEQEPDLALLAINTIQKSLSDRDPKMRALALRTMAGIRVPVISQIVALAIKKGVGDMSPIVRKAAAMAIPKCYRTDPGQLPQLTEYLAVLLGDERNVVSGAAVTALLEVCPDRIDLVHQHYRKLVRKIVDMDEWAQLSTLRLMTVYARKCFPRRTAKSGTPDDAVSDSYRSETALLDPDLKLFLDGIRPLLQSRNSGVVVAVARAYSAVGTLEYLKAVVGPLVALLRAPSDISQIALYAIVSICLLEPKEFVRYATHFLVKATDTSVISELKLEVFTLIFPHAPQHTKSLILAELEHFSRSSNRTLVRDAVRAIGRCAQSDAKTGERCLNLLLSQITSLDGTLAAESLTVIRQLIQQDPIAHTDTVVKLARNLDSAADPQARATIIWLVGEFSGFKGQDNIAPDVLRILLKTFADESELAKAQIILLAARVYLHHILREDDTLKQQQLDQEQTDAAAIAVEDADPLKLHPIVRLWNYTLLLTRYDTSYDLRDRMRLYKALLAVPQLASLMLLAPKPAPNALSPSEARKGYTIGSATQILADDGGVGMVHGLKGYEPLPDWVVAGREPNGSLRDDGSGEVRKETTSTGASAYGDKRREVMSEGEGEKATKAKTLDDWLDEGKDEDVEEESEEEDGSEESEYETDSESDEAEEEDATLRPADHA